MTILATAFIVGLLWIVGVIGVVSLLSYVAKKFNLQ